MCLYRFHTNIMGMVHNAIFMSKMPVWAKKPGADLFDNIRAQNPSRLYRYTSLLSRMPDKIKGRNKYTMVMKLKRSPILSDTGL